MSLLLLLVASLYFLGQPAAVASGVVIDAGHYALPNEEPLSNAEAAAASMDFILAEAAAAEAAVAEAATEAVSSTQEWEVWDSEDDMDVEETVDKENLPPRSPPLPVVPSPLDAIFDFALGAVVHQVVLNHSAEQPVPDFKKEFSARLGPFKVHGHLDAQGGTAGDLTSLFRDGSATLRTQPGGVLVLEAAAGLRTLRLRYSHYSARAGPIRVSGSLEAETSPATLRAQVALIPPCGAQLRSLTVANVGRLRVTATGLGVLKRLLPLLQRWMEKRVRGDVERVVLQRLSQIVSMELQRLSCK